jgi:hypothetical protein
LKVELEKKIIDEIIEILAEELEIPNLGLEEREALEKVVCLSIAVYLSRLNPENNDTGVH